MPTYTFVNSETQEEQTEFLTLSQRDEFLKSNPHYFQKLATPSIGDSVRLGVTKPDIGHRELLNNMHKKLDRPGLNLTNRQTH